MASDGASTHVAVKSSKEQSVDPAMVSLSQHERVRVLNLAGPQNIESAAKTLTRVQAERGWPPEIQKLARVRRGSE